jgi:ATP-dependent DNA helicase DinG
VPPDLPDPREQPHLLGGAAHPAVAHDQPRTRLLPLHQLRADERGVRPPARRVRLPDAAAGRRSEKRAAGGVPHDAERVLFATSSFWQGVDVQGEQLSCVIIDRLPFAVPSDPVVAARIEAIDAGAATRSSTTRCRRR